VSVQICEGVWRNRLRQRVVVTQCEPVDGQRWTDGAHHFEDNGALLTFSHSNLDLVEYIGPLPYSSQRAPVSRPAETESTTAVAGGVSDDPGRIIYEHEERLKAANATIDRLRIKLQETYVGWSDSNSALAEQTAEIDRLKAEWRSEFNAAQQLRSEVQKLELLLDDARDNLRVLEADGTAMDHHCEGQKAAYLAVIKTLAGVRA
jgi:cell division protein FtsB